MTGDCHVRFCERLGAKLPRPTNLGPPRVYRREGFSVPELAPLGG